MGERGWNSLVPYELFLEPIPISIYRWADTTNASGGGSVPGKVFTYGQPWVRAMVLSASLFASKAVGSELKKVVFGIDDFCPYTCLEKDRPGIFPEAVATILQPHHVELEIYPASWAR